MLIQQLSPNSIVKAENNWLNEEENKDLAKERQWRQVGILNFKRKNSPQLTLIFPMPLLVLRNSNGNNACFLKEIGEEYKILSGRIFGIIPLLTFMNHLAWLTFLLLSLLETEGYKVIDHLQITALQTQQGFGSGIGHFGNMAMDARKAGF